MTADNPERLTLEWLLRHPDGREFLADRITDLLDRLPYVPAYVQVHNATNLDAIHMEIGLGQGRIEWICPVAHPSAWAHYVSADKEVLVMPAQADVAANREVPGWSGPMVRELTDKVSTMLTGVVTQARAVMDARAERIRDELTPEPMKRMPTATEIEALTDLVEESAKLQAAMDVNAAYVALCAQMERPDLVSSQALTEHLAAQDPTVQVDAGLADVIADHWDRTYRGSLNQQLGVVLAEETPTEIAAAIAQENQTQQPRPDRDFPGQTGRPTGPSLPPEAPEQRRPRRPQLPPSGPEQDGGRS